MLKSIGWWVAGVCLAAGLQGCATAPPVASPTVPEVLPPDHGMVAFKVAAVRSATSVNAKWRALTLRERASGRVTTLQDLAPAGVSHALFAAPLPAGTYAITGFSVVGGGSSVPLEVGLTETLVLLVFASDSSKPPATLSTFTVEVGAATNLGVMIASLPEQKEKSASGSALLLGEDARSSVIEAMDAPSRQRFLALRTRSWDKAPDATDNARALNLALTSPGSATSLGFSADGGLLIGSTLGRVFSRDPSSANWTAVPTGSFDAISHLERLPGGALFAGTDTGRYHVWVPSQQRWVSHTLAQGERIVSLVPTTGQPGYLVESHTYPSPVAPAARTRLRFIRDLAAGGPERIVLDFANMGWQPRLQTYQDGADLIAIYNKPGFTRTADQYRIDTRTLQVSPATELDHFVKDVYRLDDGSLARTRMNGVSNYVDFSTDNGKTWERGAESDVEYVRMRTRRDGYAVKIDSIIGGPTVRLRKTTDGGKTWTPLGTPVPFNVLVHPTQLRASRDGIVIYSAWTVNSTRDEGQTWTIEGPAALH